MFRKYVIAASTFAVFVSLTSFGCSSEKSDLGEAVVGIYAVDSLTENDQGCDTEGPSVLADDRDFMVVFSGSDLFGGGLRAEGCGDVAACRQRVSDIQENRGIVVTFTFTFDTDKGDHLEGDWVTTGAVGGPDPNVCADGEVTHTTLSAPAEGTVRIESRSVVVDHPPDAQGICWTNDTQAAAAGQPCTVLRAVHATRREAL